MRGLLALLFLAGCGSDLAYRPVAVEIPVARPCAAPPVAKPDFALAHIGADEAIDIKTRAALIELTQRKAYEAQLEARQDACAP